MSAILKQAPLATAKQRVDPRRVDPRRVDPITLEVVRYSLVAMMDETEANLTRTAFSTIIREYKDYCVGMVTAKGETIAQGRARHDLGHWGIAACGPTTIRCQPAANQEEPFRLRAARAPGLLHSSTAAKSIRSHIAFRYGSFARSAHGGGGCSAGRR